MHNGGPRRFDCPCIGDQESLAEQLAYLCVEHTYSMSMHVESARNMPMEGHNIVIVHTPDLNYCLKVCISMVPRMQCPRQQWRYNFAGEDRLIQLRQSISGGEMHRVTELPIFIQLVDGYGYN